MARCRSYWYLLQPTVPQRTRLEQLLRNQCELYNAALEDRRGAWKWERRSVSYVDQCRTLTTLRAVRPEVLDHGVTVCRGTLKRLDRAFCAFYRRCRAGQTPGFPRFKSSRRFDSVQWEDRKGWRLDRDIRRLRLQGIGEIKVRLHRDLQGTAKAITVAREGRRFWVTVRCVDVPAEPLEPTGKDVGLDLGVCATVATSDGELVLEGRYGRQARARLEAAQRALATKQRGSHHRERAVHKVAAAHCKVRNQRKDLAHQLSRHLVNAYDLIAVEDLAITNHGAPPETEERRRRQLRAQRGGRQIGSQPLHLRRRVGTTPAVHRVQSRTRWSRRDRGGPPSQPQRCSYCGHVEASNRLTQARFRCQACGHEAHADINAAVNILRAGRAQQASASACAGSTD